jgi:hypothetical protein
MCLTASFLRNTPICNHPQPSATIRNHPQPSATICNHLQPSATIRNHPASLLGFARIGLELDSNWTRIGLELDSDYLGLPRITLDSYVSDFAVFRFLSRRSLGEGGSRFSRSTWARQKLPLSAPPHRTEWNFCVIRQPNIFIF